jgi:hypothetical protein
MFSLSFLDVYEPQTRHHSLQNCGLIFLCENAQSEVDIHCLKRTYSMMSSCTKTTLLYGEGQVNVQRWKGYLGKKRVKGLV